MTYRWTTVLAPALVSLALIGCTGEEKVDSGVVCDDPVANAGADQSVTLGATVTLDAAASTVCDVTVEEAVYTWTVDQVPAGSAVDDSALSDNATNTAIAPSFVPDVDGDFVLSLVVSDENGESAADYAVIAVVTGDQPPVADCGPDISGIVDEQATFDGTGSSDPEGADIDYTWTLTAAPACSSLTSTNIYNNAGPTPSLVPDCDGSYTVSLVVSDGVNYSDPDICYLTVGSDNNWPVADAGDSQDLGGCADNPVELDAYGSYDEDGDSLTYEWSVYSAPAESAVTDANFDDNTAAAPQFTWDVAGEYTFQLQVNDGTVWSDPDLVTVSIDDADNNRRPIANGGDDQEIAEEADCTSASYLWTCDDCQASWVELDGSASTDPDADSLRYTWAEATRTLVFSAPASSITRATVPSQPATYGSASSTQFEVSLTVEDCAESDEDTVLINYSCEGVAE